MWMFNAIEKFKYDKNATETALIVKKLTVDKDIFVCYILIICFVMFLIFATFYNIIKK